MVSLKQMVIFTTGEVHCLSPTINLQNGTHEGGNFTPHKYHPQWILHLCRHLQKTINLYFYPWRDEEHNTQCIETLSSLKSQR